MRTVRRLLPLVAVAALLITLVAPIMVPDDPDFDIFHVTSAGERGSTDLLPLMLSVWAVVLLAAATAWLPRWPAVRVVFVVLAALALFVYPMGILLEPPLMMWDGWDEESGQPVGGMVRGRPSIGSVLWVVGSVALTASAVLGTLEAVRPRRGRDGGDAPGTSTAPAGAAPRRAPGAPGGA